MLQPVITLPRTPGEHFKLYFYAAVLHVVGQVYRDFDSPEAAFEQFPFLVGYLSELAQSGLEGMRVEDGAARWRDALVAWEREADGHLPLRALRQAGDLDHDALTLLVAAGLPDEDPRFGRLFESLQGTPGGHRPTAGLLSAWWAGPDGARHGRTILRRLRDLGLLRAVNPDAPGAEQQLQVPAPVWAALGGETSATPAPGMSYRPPTELHPVDGLILPADVHGAVSVLPQLLAAGQAGAVIVRGPRHNGRRTLLGALARALGRGLLTLAGPLDQAGEQWRLAGLVATALHALPAVVLEVAPGETVELPPLNGYDGPVGIVIGPRGGVHGPCVERAVTLVLPAPDPDARRLHWQQALGDRSVEGLDLIAETYRVTSGAIHAAAGGAGTVASLTGRTAVTPADVREAVRSLDRQALDTLAERVSPVDGWQHLAVSDDTAAELQAVAWRCRFRERLGGAVGAAGAQLNPGVRVLFSGPSGTGKTLAARMLAGALGRDLYRLDLAAVVNKYIGETEKNLDRVFARAEELDVILLLDEGDALLTRRTSVQTSNDRYANLETDYLLQRLESFEGILIVTTNAVERIDAAFQRRMDAVVPFHPPEAAERWTIWQLHLPAGHDVPRPLLEEVARRCELRGGQIRNAALHAVLLALEAGRPVAAAHLEAAVQREYRKIGAVCPLRLYVSINGRG